MKKFKSRKRRKRLAEEKYENVYMTKFISNDINSELFKRHANFIYSAEGLHYSKELNGY